MKKSAVLTSIILVLVLVGSWIMFFVGITANSRKYDQCISKAKQSITDELYEQAIEFYKESLKYKEEEQTYLWIKKAYDLWYAEESIAYVRNCYITDMEAAAKAYPKNELFWLRQIQLYMEGGQYKKAFSTAKSAINRKVESKDISSIYNELLYMVEVSYKKYETVRTPLNGYVTVYDGTIWTVLDDNGDAIVEHYDYIGLINDDGKGMYSNYLGCRILDNKQVARAKLRKDFTNAGYYNEGVDLMPVEYEGAWRYTNSKGELLPGKYDICGSFYGEEAVACRDGVWMIVDSDGDESVLKDIEDVKLDLYGCHIQNDVIICKKDGTYRLFDEDFDQISEFKADDIDCCVSTEGIAFRKDDLWGFVDLEGKVLIKPQYTNAKSFANGYAAVCNQNGYWGFIDTDGELVIDYSYVDAMYFSKAETCWISLTEGTWQLLKFMFE